MAMLAELLTILVSCTAGAVTGGLAGGLVARRWRPPDECEQPEHPGFRDFPEDQARQVARQWRETRGMPAQAEGIIVNKLRLGWDLQHGRGRRRGGPR